MRVLIGGDGMPTRLAVRLLWEPRDVWVGVFWTEADGLLLVYICLVPCLPLVICVPRSRKAS